MGDEQSLLDKVVEECRQEHSTLFTHWNALDTKAQGTIETAGIFVAGILAFISAIARTDSRADRLLLSLAAVLLAACILSALRVLFVRKGGSPPAAADFLRLVDDEVREGSRGSGDHCSLSRSHIRMWTDASAAVRRIVESKTHYQRLAHCLLAGAVALAILAALTRIWGSP
jgi:hypothetical protein